MSIGDLIHASVRCVKCGAKGVGTCDCWVKCPCGWTKGRDEPCGNPIHGGAPRPSVVTHGGSLPPELATKAKRKAKKRAGLK